MRVRSLSLLLLSVVCTIMLVGCGIGTLAGPELNVASDAMQGRMMGGNQPVVGATVSIYAVGSTAYGTASTTALASTQTDGNGFWGFAPNAYMCPASNTPMYIVAAGGNPGAGTNVNGYFLSLVPQCSSGMNSYFWMNEVTTAAAVLAAGQFMGTGLGQSNATPQIGGTCSGCATGTYNRGLVAAFANTYPQLVNNATGNVVASSTFNGVTITRETAKLTSIANVLASCVNSTGSTSTTETTTLCGKLFTDVNATGANPRPYTTIQAALEMALYPYYNVSTTFALSGASPPFGGGLTTAPNDWTTAISYTTSSLGLGIQQNTSSNLDIDSNGSVYFPSNKTGANGFGLFNPATSSFSRPLVQGLVRYPQYVAIDRSSTPYVWATDMNSSYLIGLSTTTLSGGVGYGTSSYTTSGPITVDASNNVVVAANTSSSHLVYTLLSSRSSGIVQATSVGGNYSLLGAPNGLTVAESVGYSNGYIFAGDTSSACNLEFSPGTANDQNQPTGSSSCVVGGVLSTTFGYYTGYSTTSTNAICYLNGFLGVQDCPTYATLNVAKGFAADGAGHFWVANAGNASVSTFSVSSNCYVSFCNAVAVGGSSAVAYLHGTGNGGTATVPYGIGIDGSGNIWVSNADCVSTSSTACSATSFTLTEVIGAAAPTITPVSAQNSSNPTFGSRPSN